MKTGKIVKRFLLGTMICTMPVQIVGATDDLIEESGVDICSNEYFDISEENSDEILIESEFLEDDSLNLQEEMTENQVTVDIDSNDLFSDDSEELDIESITVCEESLVEDQQFYSKVQFTGDPVVNTVEYNQYYSFNELEWESEIGSQGFYLKTDFPDDGRAKVMVVDCSSACMDTEWKHTRYDGELGLDYQEWVQTGPEIYDSGWLTVKAGEVAFVLKDTKTINAEARVIIKYQNKSEYYGELESNDTYDTATRIENNVVYEGNYSISSDEDIYKFVMEEAGLAEIQVKMGGKMEFYMLYEEDLNGNVSKISSFIPGTQAVLPRLRLAPGNYFVKVFPTKWADQTQYTICANVTYESADLYEQEKNNVTSQANEKQVNRWYTGNLNSTSDVDNFKIVVPKMGYISVEFKVPRQTESDKIRISLYNGNMDSLSTASNTENPYLKLDEKIYPAGTYYVRVEAGENNSRDFDFYDDYSFNVNFSPAHNWNTGYTIDKAATCIETGLQSIHCSECDAIKDGSQIVIPMVSHSWSVWNTIVAPTMRTEGREQRTCQVCGTKESRSVAKLPAVLVKVTMDLPSVASGDNIHLSWKAVDNAEGYVVYRNTGKKWVKIATLKGNVLEYTDTDTKIGSTYSYSVRGYMVVDGNTIYSPSNKPGVSIKQTFYGEAVKMKYAKPLSTKSIKIKWTGRKKSSGYIIYRKVAGKSWKKIATVGKKNTYTDKTCKSATTYQYAVKAYTKAGTKNIYSKMEKIGAVAISKMEKPKLTVKSTVKKRATLKWTKQSNVSGYVIYRKEAGGSWEKIKRVSAKASSYTDKGLKRKKTYYYIVKAYKKALPKIGLTEPTYSSYMKKKVKVK